MSPAEALLLTVADSADPIARAEAQLALLLGNFDPTQNLESLLHEASNPAPGTFGSLQSLIPLMNETHHR